MNDAGPVSPSQPADAGRNRLAASADEAVRLSSIAVVVLVAVGAAVVSYRHAYDLVHAHGETGTTAAIVPATVDGMIYASSMVLLQSARRGHRGSWLAYVGLSLGVMATVAANVAHGWAHGLIGALVGAWPAVALVLSYEMLMWIVRADRSPKDAGGDALALVDFSHVPPPEIQVVEVAGPAPRNLAEAVIAATAEGLSVRATAAAFEVTRHRVETILRTAEGEGEVADPGLGEVAHSPNGQHPEAP